MSIYGSGLYGAGSYGIVIRMSYHPNRKVVFISRSDTLTYILGKDGLTAISGRVDDIAHKKNEVIIHAPVAIIQDNITFSTDIINFKSRGLKALEWVQLEVDNAEDIFVTVRYRDSTRDAWASAPRKRFNEEGVCRIGVRGIDFILDFDIPNFTVLHLDSAELSVQFVDRRFRRGIRAEG